MSERATIFVDTCVFLEFNHFLQLPWKKIVPFDQITLVVCLAVVGELDEEKTYNRNRRTERAKRALADIEKNENSEIQSGVSVQYFHESPRRDTYPETMDPDLTDDRIIQSALVYRQRNPAAGEICIATADQSMALRCRAFSIKVAKIPESERLAPPDDDAKKIRKLEAELMALKNRLPTLDLVVTPDDGDPATTDPQGSILPSPIFRQQDVENAVNERKKEHPKINTSEHSNGPPHIWPVMRRNIDKQELNRYNKELDTYYSKCATYYSKLNSWVSARGTFFHFDLFMQNSGRSMATHIQLEMAFPPFVRLLGSEDIETLPMPPMPPEEPRSSAELLMPSIPSLSGLGKPILQQIAEQPVTPKARCSNRGNEARLFAEVGRLLHGDSPILFGHFILWFLAEEQPRKFGAQYTVRSAELPTEQKGTLVFQPNLTR